LIRQRSPMSKAKAPPARKTRPSFRVKKKHTYTEPPVSEERRRKRAEAETLPPPAPEPSLPPRASGRVKKGPPAVTVDEVTADMSKDPRRED
jgi:hypothetical protein